MHTYSVALRQGFGVARLRCCIDTPPELQPQYLCSGLDSAPCLHIVKHSLKRGGQVFPLFLLFFARLELKFLHQCVNNKNKRNFSLVS